MMIDTKLLGLGLVAISAFWTAPATAQAQTTVTSQALKMTGVVPPSPERLAVAQAIVVTAWPPERREAMMDKLIATFASQFRDSAHLETIENPGFSAILRRYLDSIPGRLKPLVSDFIPRQMDAIAIAYARMFTLTELRDVLAFAQTPSGAQFMQRGIDAISDPDVAAVNTAYLTKVHQLSAEAAAEVAAEVQAYVASQRSERPPA